MKLYGLIDNRLEENKNYTGRDIQVGDDITMYYWSDRKPFYVTKVIDQKHIFVRPYIVYGDMDKTGGMGHQNWMYFKTKEDAEKYLREHGSDYEENENKEEEWVFRYKKWRRVVREEYGTVYPKPIYRELEPISFGVRDYYYDWEF